jgi:Ca2+-transporting ATPase
MRTLGEIQARLPCSSETGLSSDAAAQSRHLFGINRLTPVPRPSMWMKFLEKLDEPIIQILLAAALLSMFVDLFNPPESSARFMAGGIVVGLAAAAVALVYRRGAKEWVSAVLFAAAVVLELVGLLTDSFSMDGLAIMIAVILATGVAFLSEHKSQREFEALNADKESIRVRVLRSGAFHTIPLEEVVVGETVILERGDEIPADGRVVQASELHLDQSLMTGESEPVRKQAAAGAIDAGTDGPEQPGCVYRGTQVADGLGRMIVTEVGDATYLGRIARQLSGANADEGEQATTARQRVQRKLTISRELTPLQLKLKKLTQQISKVGYVAASAIFLALLVRGLAAGEVGWPSPGFLDSGRSLLHYFMYMVIIIVVAVPEGLPMSVTISLALAMRKMTRANSLVRQLVACETVGSTTVICTDKTGTLTQNKMQVVRLCWDSQVFDRGRDDWPSPECAQGEAEDARPLSWLVLNAAVNSTAQLEEKQGKLLPVGSSTEGALLLWLLEGGCDYNEIRGRLPAVYQIHFSSDRKRMTTVVRRGGELVALVKGAPDRILERCVSYQAADGTVRPWTDEARAAVGAHLKETAGRAMRTLAFAYATLPPDCPGDADGLHACREAIEKDLIYVGFVAIRDPLRNDVVDAVASCRRAGIDVKMLTGDDAETARAIGAEIGLLDVPECLVWTSADFNALGDVEVKDKLAQMRILARAQPLDKLRLVKLLQERQEVVAVTGDGTNDAPALKKADVGLAMGRAGTEVAKEASKIILLDDAFSTIVKAVHWGRALYENMQRFIQFQLTINVSALAIAFLGPLLGVEPPFTVLQLLWINVIMDTLAAIALCSEPPRPGLMLLPPKRRDENILTPAMLWNIVTTAGFFVAVMLGLLLGLKYGGWFAGGAPSTDLHGLTVRQVSIFFTTYIFFQVWNEINCRSLAPEISGFRGLLQNPTFLGIVGLIVVVQVLIVTLGGEVFKVEALYLGDWLLIGAFTATVLVFGEVTRRVRLAVGRTEKRQATSASSVPG